MGALIPALQASWPPKTASRALVIVNEAAGGVGAGARAAMLALLSELNVEPVDVIDNLEELNRAKRAAKKADVIIVLGGDGTARAAAEEFGEAAPLILLPGGTLNVLPRALYGDLTWAEALKAAFAEGRVTRLVGGKANGKKFFVAALFGAPTLLARAREAVREGKLLAAARRFRHAFNRAFSRSLAARPEGGQAHRAEGIGVLCPAYSGELQDRTLEWVKLDVGRITDFVRVGLRSVIGGWRDDPTIEVARCKRGEIRSRGVIPAVLDGEPTTFVSRVKIDMLAKGPRVISLH